MRTFALFAAILAIFVAAGGLLGAYIFGSFVGGLAVALGLSLALNLITYFFCDRLVLWSTRARVVPEAEAPRLAKAVNSLAPEFHLDRPRLAIIPSRNPNAFATGRSEKRAVVAVTEGLLRVCDDRELRAVLAHEMAHIRDRDILVMTFAATLAGAISYAAQMVFYQSLFGGLSNRSGVNPLLLLFAAITAPIAAMLIQLAISRARELRADEVGARTIRDPLALASALEKLEVYNERRPQPLGSPATASLFIVNPFRGGAFASLFSTHPATDERIRRLRAMSQDFRYTPSYSVLGDPAGKSTVRSAA